MLDVETLRARRWEVLVQFVGQCDG
jgi:hypothetical protein